MSQFKSARIARPTPAIQHERDQNEQRRLWLNEHQPKVPSSTQLVIGVTTECS